MASEGESYSSVSDKKTDVSKGESNIYFIMFIWSRNSLVIVLFCIVSEKSTIYEPYAWWGENSKKIHVDYQIDYSI